MSRAPLRVRPRRALTLVEVLVAATLSTVVLAGAVLVYNLGGRSRSVTATARALQTAMLVDERVTEDLAHLVLARPAPLRFWPDRLDRLGFYIFDRDGSKDRTIGVRSVLYALDGAPALLTREWSGRRETVGVSPLASLEFHPMMSPTGPLVRATLTVAHGPDEPAGPPLVHSFIARVAAPRHATFVSIQILSAFLDPRDAPTDQPLPVP